jgi:Recombination endonuclease VII
VPEIITRAEALAKGLKRYFTGEPCKRGHVAERSTVNSTCFACKVTADAAGHKVHREKRLVQGAVYRAAHREELNVTHTAYRAAHRVERKVYDAARVRPHAEEKERKIAAHLKNTFGITPAYYAFLLANQGGGCAHCGKPETSMDRRWGVVRRLSVDHCHDTGRVRGLLCNSCNPAMGKLGDTLEHFRTLTRYLAGVTIQHPLQCLLDLPPAPDLSLQIPTTGPVRTMVWGSKSGPDTISSWEVLTRLERPSDGTR